MTLIERSAHFEFGENWRDYAKSIDEARIDSAIAGLQKLFPDGLAGRSFLDIGCGSGLNALAALKMGADRVMAIDLDENSVATTRALLMSHVPSDKNWLTSVASLFDLTSARLGTFDVVYSWGVLHHTGDMWRAIETASRLVYPGGQFAFAIYARTKLGNLWRVEKRIYSGAPRVVQAIIRCGYMATYIAAKAATGIGPLAFLRDYRRNRGMNFSHDAHDWLGGYPYEEATAKELHDRVEAMGFRELRSFRLPVARGIFGSGCHEFVFKKA